MAETVTVTEADLVTAIKSLEGENKPEGADNTVESFASFLFSRLRTNVDAGEVGVGGPDSGVTDDDNVDNTAANNG